MNVTVVIATRDRRAQLLRTLPCRRAPVVVVVVDNGFTDRTADAVSAAVPAARVVRVDGDLGGGRATSEPRPPPRGTRVRRRRLLLGR